MSEAGPKPQQPDFKAFRDATVVVNQTYEALYPFCESEVDETLTFEDGVTLVVKFVGPVEADILDKDGESVGTTEVDSIIAKEMSSFWPNWEHGCRGTCSFHFKGTSVDGAPIYVIEGPEKIADMELICPDILVKGEEDDRS